MMTLEEIEKEPSLLVVGCGRWGRNLISTAFQLGQLAAVVEPIQATIEDISKKLESSLKAFPDLTEGLEAFPNAAVVIATPPLTHYSLAKEALEKGHDVFVEKPLCTSYEDGDDLVRLAAREGRVLMVDHLLQYSFQHRRLLNLVSSGFVGEITRVKMTRFNFGTIRTQENVLWSFSPHDISVLLGLNEKREPVSVTCSGQYIVSSEVEDYVDLNVLFNDGVRAQLEASWLHPLKERRLIVYGDEGVLILNEAMPDASAPKLQGFKWTTSHNSDGSSVMVSKYEVDVDEVWPSANDSISSTSSSDDPPLTVALKHFLYCVSSRTPPKTDGKEGLSVLSILQAADLSLKKEGGSVDISTATTPSGTFIHDSAFVDEGASIGCGSKVWHFTHIMPNAVIGERCNIGQNVFIGNTAKLGRNVKVQNNVSIYDSVEVEDDAFLGPSCVFTNVKNPRSHISQKHAYFTTHVGKGATIGANATVVCGCKLGNFSFIGAGAVVTKDVPAHALVYGNPAQINGWVSTSGTRLVEKETLDHHRSVLYCEQSKETYTLFARGLDGASEAALVPFTAD